MNNDFFKEVKDNPNGGGVAQMGVFEQAMLWEPPIPRREFENIAEADAFLIGNGWVLANGYAAVPPDRDYLASEEEWDAIDYCDYRVPG